MAVVVEEVVSEWRFLVWAFAAGAVEDEIC